MSSPVLTNQRGILTVEMIFGIFVTVGLITLLLRLTYTLAVVEVAQYVVFATSRAYSAAHTSEDSQKDQAILKYTRLVQENPALKRVFSSRWFKVPEKPTVGHFSASAQRSPASPIFENDEDQTPFTGARIEFQSSVLSITIPFLGSTTGEDGQPFSAGIASFLIREPSLVECQDFMKARFEGLMALRNYGNIKPDASSYYPMEDNGC